MSNDQIPMTKITLPVLFFLVIRHSSFFLYLWRSLAAHHLAMVKAPVQIRLGTLVGLMV